ncbi:MAG: hypothetical protein ACRC9V_09365, partial [Aeromonas sp.]
MFTQASLSFLRCLELTTISSFNSSAPQPSSPGSDAGIKHAALLQAASFARLLTAPRTLPALPRPAQPGILPGIFNFQSSFQPTSASGDCMLILLPTPSSLTIQIAQPHALVAKASKKVFLLSAGISIQVIPSTFAHQPQPPKKESHSLRFKRPYAGHQTLISRSI